MNNFIGWYLIVLLLCSYYLFIRLFMFCGVYLYCLLLRLFQDLICKLVYLAYVVINSRSFISIVMVATIS